MIVYAIIQAMTFVAGVLVLLQGVRMFLGEIIPAFKGISEKLIPGARPALDVPIFYASGPVATTVGFLCHTGDNSDERCCFARCDWTVLYGRSCWCVWR